MIKIDEKILNKYLKGKTIKTSLTTPLKSVRAYSTESNEALFIATGKEKNKLSSMIALVAAQKGWNLSIYTEGSYLVCLLCP